MPANSARWHASGAWGRADKAWGSQPWSSWGWQQRGSEGWSSSPPGKSERRAQELAEALRAVQVEEGQRISLAQPMPPSFTGPQESWDRAQENRQVAAKLKCLRTLAALASTEQEHTYYMGLVQQYRAKTTVTQEPAARLGKAMEELADARVKAQRARKHAEEAHLALAKADSLVAAAEAELSEARAAAQAASQAAAAAAPPGSQPSGIAPTPARPGPAQMLQALEVIKAMAHVDETGNMVLQASAFEEVAGAVAGAPSPSGPAAVAQEPPGGQDIGEASDTELEEAFSDGQLERGLQRMTHPTGLRRQSKKGARKLLKMGLPRRPVD